MQQPDQIDIEAQNAAVRKWFSDTLQDIKNRYISLVQSPGRSGDGLDSLKSRTYQSAGEIDHGGFKFDRYLIFIHKGAGRGFGGSRGSTWYDPHGLQRSTNPASLGKMNTGSRHAEEWMNPVLDEDVPKLADIIAGFKADLAVKQIQIK